MENGHRSHLPAGGRPTKYLFSNLTQKTQPETIIFGQGAELFANQMLLLDSIYYTSKGILQKPLEKNIQIDIDDIFVGEPGTRIGVSDVNAMVEFTDKWKEQIPGFHFVVGFSGKFINRGNETEDAGDLYILEKKGFYSYSNNILNAVKIIFAGLGTCSVI